MDDKKVLDAINEVCDGWYLGAGRALSHDEKVTDAAVRGVRVELLGRLGLPVEWPDGMGAKYPAMRA